MEIFKEYLLETSSGYQLSNQYVDTEEKQNLCRQYGGKFFKKMNLWRFNKMMIDMCQTMETIKKEDKMTQTEIENEEKEYQYNPPSVFYDIIADYFE